MNYTEAQYRRYCMFLETMANEDDFAVGYQMHLKLNDWLKKEKITDSTRDEMDERVLKEDMERFGKRNE